MGKARSTGKSGKSKIYKIEWEKQDLQERVGNKGRCEGGSVKEKITKNKKSCWESRRELAAKNNKIFLEGKQN